MFTSMHTNHPGVKLCKRVVIYVSFASLDVIYNLFHLVYIFSVNGSAVW